MTSIGSSAVQVTLSGRELALQRRQAMALRGKAGVVRSAAAQSAAAAAPRPAMALARPTPRTAVAALDAGRSAPVTAPTASAARQRRQALSQSGKSALGAQAVATRPARSRAPVASPQQTLAASDALAADCGCGCNGTGCAIASGPIDAFAAQPACGGSAASCAPAMDMGSTRALARARRVALATDGKKGLVRVAQATRLAAVLPQQDWQQAIEKGASGREVAKQRRLVRALVGRAEVASTAPRPNGRMRAKNETAAAPPKVAIGHTLSGQSVTGTPVDSSRKVTGNEAGACTSVTGTEYLSLEQFSSVCGTRPAPGPAKVALSSTLREQKVTGTEVGRSAHVTGDEAGSCRSVTGTEYLSREQQQTVCDAVPLPGPRKVSVMSSQGGQAVSGVEVGRSVKVTGNEPGATRQLTGSQYFNATDFGQPAGREAPPKVATVQTLAGSTVTGTEVGLSSKVTGDDRGGCRAVTGTEYISARQQGAVCATTEPVQPVRKVGQDQTWNDQTITGTRVGRSRQVTGDEHGGCAPISGTSYIGVQQYQGFCEPAQRDSQWALGRREALISAATVTGDRPGAGGSAMTGDQRGACGPISGTPYFGADNLPQQCGTSGRFVAPARPEKTATPAATAKDFSIRPPSRQAQERASGGVTGSAFSGQRITGTVNKGGGLITGTPEFRHRESVPMPAPQREEVSAATRLTGEGSQSGARISGAAWQTSGRVTGTEGTSSLARNPSQRGEARGQGMSALQFRKAERVEQPQSRVTGSSGNTAKGAAVTLSGGARG
ncbi:MAG: carboxysome shell protein [Hydrogenophaga sp.]|nr:carboxysome shell protein [Hydrogenophaga sp.]